MSQDIANTDSSATESEDYSEEEMNDYLGGMSEEQKKIIQDRLDAVQKQFKVFNSNQRSQKIRDVLSHIKDIDEKTAELAIDSCHGNELLAIKRLLDDSEYKTDVVEMAAGKKEVDMDAILYRDKNQEIREALAELSDNDSDVEEGDAWEMKQKHHRRREVDQEASDVESEKSRSKSEHRIPRLCLDDALIMLANITSAAKDHDHKTDTEEAEANSEERENSSETASSNGKEEEAAEIPTASSLKRRDSKETLTKEKELFKALSGSKANKLSDDVLRQLGWSDARIKAFKNREKNPNQYYYRFNDPGEPQATGKWSAKDKALFLKLVNEKGVDYQWGIFSMQIPGRVGYQCSNFYRQLIKEGEIKDENYQFDKNGKLVFLFRDKNGKSTLVRQKRASDSTGSPRKRAKKVVVEKIPEEPVLPAEPEESVLPDYIDPMTMMPVVKPAISPYGHVMGYDSWVKILNKEPKNTCPFTKKHLTRRALVKLTESNIDEYRDKIISVTGFAMPFSH